MTFDAKNPLALVQNQCPVHAAENWTEPGKPFHDDCSACVQERDEVQGLFKRQQAVVLRKGQAQAAVGNLLPTELLAEIKLTTLVDMVLGGNTRARMVYETGVAARVLEVYEEAERRSGIIVPGRNGH